MRLIDYHVHSFFSPDSSMELQDAIENAILKGVRDICFTEHMDLGHHIETFNTIPDFKGINDSISNLKNKYDAINILKGLEVGYIPETVPATIDVLNKEDFDYILLSVHCVDGVDCYLPESKRGRDKERAYKRYLEVLYESVSDNRLAQSYDCVGHIGYIAKCMHYEDNTFPYEMFPSLFDEILKKIISNGKGIEVNTSGVDRIGHVLPHPSIINRYRELGGTIITIGSDAHRPQQVGYYIKEGLQLMKKCGFDEVALFTGHVPMMISI